MWWVDYLIKFQFAGKLNMYNSANEKLEDREFENVISE